MCFYWCFTPIHIIKYLCDIYVLGLYVFEAIMTILVKIFMLLHKVHVQVTKHFNMKEEQKTVFLGLTDGESHSHNHE